MKANERLIRRTVYWNESAGGWYDDETDVHVKNMPQPPINNSKLREFAEQQGIPIDRWAPVQTERYPSDQAELRETVRPIAQRAVAEYLTNHTAQSHMYFEQGRDYLVTVAYLHESMHTLIQANNILERRVTALSRPWWKRWFRR